MWQSDESDAQPFLIYPDPAAGWGSLTWEHCRVAVESRVRSAEQLRGRRVGLIVRPGAAAIVWLLAMRELGATCVLLAAGTEPSRILSLTELLQLEYLVDGEDVRPIGEIGPARETAEARIVILTSGTTAAPKAVAHSWETLVRPVRTTAALTGSRWLLTFAPHLYAGLQVFFHVWCNRGTLVLLPENRSPDAIIEAIAAHRVGYVSATPSFWRYLLFASTRAQQRRCVLNQITLGGESVEQALLDRLKAAFPAARLVHIYATTELGRCFSVTDGREGFPKSYLNGPLEEGTELRVEDGELLVRSANRMIGYAASPDGSAAAAMLESDGWIRTGDSVQVTEDRVLFRGRNSDIANIGGHKVSPIAVEVFLRTLPEVEDALVYSVRSSIAGQLLGCDVVLRPGVDREAGKHSVIRQCAQGLGSPMRPRLWKVVDEIPLLAGGKRIRRRDAV